MIRSPLSRLVRIAKGAGLFLGLLQVAQAGSATSVNGLYYTGVDNNGGLLAGATTDSHWAVTYAYALGVSDNPTFQGAAYVVSSSNYYPGWAPNTSAAQWITAPGARTVESGGRNTTNTGGTYLPGSGTTGANRASYIYTLAFNIAGTGTGIVTNQVSISLTLAADNQATVYINPTTNSEGNITGGLVGGSLLNAWNNTTSLTLQNYGASPNASFVIGTNTLVIQVDNTRSIIGDSDITLRNPSGLLLYQTGNSILIDGQPVPEVGVWLPIAGALVLFLWKQRRKTVQPAVA